MSLQALAYQGMLHTNGSVSEVLQRTLQTGNPGQTAAHHTVSGQVQLSTPGSLERH
ncbi:hypothetical protein ABBQ38_004740 [Trebouxia sp. C0009 RCD-2024]